MLIAESYGGRDEPVDTLTNNFVGVGVEPVFEPIRVKEEPNEATYQVSKLLLLSSVNPLFTVATKRRHCGASANGVLRNAVQDVADSRCQQVALHRVQILQIL